MKPIHIASDASPEELAGLAISVHNAVGRMPIVMKARGRAGVLVEDGLAQEAVHEGEALDSVFSGEDVKQVRVDGGKHEGAIMFASAIVDQSGQRVAAIGVIDILGMLSLKEFVAIDKHVDRQLSFMR